MIINELKRAIYEKRCWILLLIGVIIGISQFVMYSLPLLGSTPLLLQYNFRMASPFTIYSSWLGGSTFYMQNYLYYIILPILTAGSYADSLFVEMKSGYIKNALIRQSRNTYFKSKLVTAFIIGGAIFVIPLVFNFALTATVAPIHLPQISASASAVRGKALLGDLYYSLPWLYVLFYMVVDYVYAGIIACLAMLTAFYVEHRFFVYATPFVTWMFIHSVCGMIDRSNWSPIYFLNPGSGMAKGIVVLTFLAILVASTVIIIYRNRRNDVL